MPKIQNFDLTVQVSWQTN